MSSDMLEAIIGDIIGSRWNYNPTKSNIIEHRLRKLGKI